MISSRALTSSAQDLFQLRHHRRLQGIHTNIPRSRVSAHPQTQGRAVPEHAALPQARARGCGGRLSGGLQAHCPGSQVPAAPKNPSLSRLIPKTFPRVWVSSTLTGPPSANPVVSALKNTPECDSSHLPTSGN